MDKLEKMILQAREERAWFRQNKHPIDAAAAAIREIALCDARAAIVGKKEPPWIYKI